MEKSYSNNQTANSKFRPERPGYKQYQSRWFSWLGWLGRKGEAIIKGMAFTLRVVLRNNIGSKSFSFWTILYAYICTRFLLTWDLGFSSWPDTSQWNGFPENFEKWLFLTKTYIIELYENIKRIYRTCTIFWPMPQRSFMLLIYSYVFILATLGHKRSNNYKFRNRIPRDRENRGDSFFFGGLVGRKIPLSKHVFRDHHVKIYLEPPSVILFGWLFYNYGDQQFGLFLIIGALCLAFEEFRSYLDWRNYLESIDDQEFHFKSIGEDRTEFS